MPHRWNTPGCPCCDKLCDWAAFDATLGVSDQFAGDTGDWTINTAAETIATTAANVGLLHLTTYPYNADATRDAGIRGTVDPYHQHSVVCQFRATNAGTVAYLIVCAADADNYIALEITWGDIVGTFRLVQVTAGTPAAISNTHTIAGLGAGNTVWAAVDFDAGEVRACVSSGKDAWGNSGCDEILSDGLWVRGTRSSTDAVPYAGESVGFAVGYNNGTLTVYGFEAGCSAVKEQCAYESEGFLPNLSPWSADGWTNSGTTPTRIAWGDDYALEATAAAVLVHKNPLPAVYSEACLVAGVFAVRDYRLAMGAFSYGLLINCDATGSNGHKVTVTVTPTAEDAESVTCNYAIQLAAIGTGGGTINAAYSGTLEIPRGVDYELPTLRVYRLGDRLKLDGVAAAHEATGITDCGDYAGALLTPGDHVVLTSWQVFLVSEVNEHWPSSYSVCSGILGACLFCDDGEFAYTVVAEVAELEDSVCNCDWLNRGWYCTGGGCTKQSPMLSQSPNCQPNVGEGVTWDVQEARMTLELYAPLPGNWYGLEAGKIHLLATLFIVLRNTAGTMANGLTLAWAYNSGVSAVGGTIDCRFENVELSWVGYGPGSIWPGASLFDGSNFPASKVFVTGL